VYTYNIHIQGRTTLDLLLVSWQGHMCKHLCLSCAQFTPAITKPALTDSSAVSLM
jgi:hypothetical protein